MLPTLATLTQIFWMGGWCLQFLHFHLKLSPEPPSIHQASAPVIPLDRFSQVSLSHKPPVYCCYETGTVWSSRMEGNRRAGPHPPRAHGAGGRAGSIQRSASPEESRSNELKSLRVYGLPARFLTVTPEISLQSHDSLYFLYCRGCLCVPSVKGTFRWDSQPLSWDSLSPPRKKGKKSLSTKTLHTPWNSLQNLWGREERPRRYAEGNHASKWKLLLRPSPWEQGM